MKALTLLLLVVTTGCYSKHTYPVLHAKDVCLRTITIDYSKCSSKGLCNGVQLNSDCVRANTK